MWTLREKYISPSSPETGIFMGKLLIPWLQATWLQIHLSDQQFYCLLRCDLYKKFDGNRGNNPDTALYIFTYDDYNTWSRHLGHQKVITSRRILLDVIIYPCPNYLSLRWSLHIYCIGLCKGKLTKVWSMWMYFNAILCFIYPHPAVDIWYTHKITFKHVTFHQQTAIMVKYCRVLYPNCGLIPNGFETVF